MDALTHVARREQSDLDIRSRMESLLADITMLRALFFEGLRKSRAQQRLQAESPGKVAMVQVCAAQGAFFIYMYM